MSTEFITEENILTEVGEQHQAQGQTLSVILYPTTTTTIFFINSHLRQVTEDRHVHHRLLKENN